MNHIIKKQEQEKGRFENLKKISVCVAIPSSKSLKSDLNDISFNPARFYEFRLVLWPMKRRDRRKEEEGLYGGFKRPRTSHYTGVDFHTQLCYVEICHIQVKCYAFWV